MVKPFLLSEMQSLHPDFGANQEDGRTLTIHFQRDTEYWQVDIL